MQIPSSPLSLLIRTYYGNPRGWDELKEKLEKESLHGFKPNIAFYENTKLEGFNAADLLEVLEKSNNVVLFIADKFTFENPMMPVLCIDLFSRLEVRCIPEALWSIESNLSTSNMDMMEFIEAVGEDNIFKGF